MTISNLESYIDTVVGAITSLRSDKYNIGGYSCVQDYIQQNGRLFESSELTSEESSKVRSLDLRRFKVKQCYYNSQSLTLFDKGFKYCEGLAVSKNSILPVDHAWVTLNGKVVDLTWKRNSDNYQRKNRVMGVIPEGFEYYGIEFDREQVSMNVTYHKVWQPLIDDYGCHWPLLRGMIEHGRDC